MAKIQYIDNTKCLWRRETTGTLLAGMKNGQAIQKNSLVFSYEVIRTHLPCDITMPLLGVHTREMKTYSHTTVHKSLQQPKWPSVGEGMTNCSTFIH